MTIDLLSLPDVNFVDTDATAIEQAVITTYEGITGAKLYPGDPVRLFLEALAAVIIQQRALINTTGKSNLLRFAAGDVLDHIGALTETERLGTAAASVTMRFSVDGALSFAVPVPVGTRVTPDGNLVFATTSYGEIAAGETSVDIAAQCSSSGEVGNGFVPGQINLLVDPLGFVTSVTNTTTSAGGSDLESDDSFRARIQLSLEKFSTAGPDGAYYFWALSAHQDIVDVSVSSPSPGVVRVYPLCEDGEIPGAEILDQVSETLNDTRIRPLTDQVEVLAPSAQSYDVELTYYVDRANATLAAQIQQSVDTAVAGWVAWQKAKLGRDINPSELISRVQAAGAKRVEVVSPVFTAVDFNAVPQDDVVDVQYGGLEDG